MQSSNQRLKIQSNTKVLDKIGLSTRSFLKDFSKYQAKAYLALGEFEEFIKDLEAQYGYTQTVKILKDINSKCRHYAVGYPKIEEKATFGGIWFRTCKSSGLPKKLGNLKRFIDKEPNVALAIPNSVYLLETDVSTDIRTVVAPYKGTITKEELDEFSLYLGTNAPRLHPSDVKLHITCKGGPNGPSAICQAQDAASLLMISYWDYLQKVRIVYGENSYLEKIWVDFSKEVITTDAPIKFNKGKYPVMAKLEMIPSAAGKTRIVYILNYWVQQLLLPIHDSLMASFKDMANDCTWKQEAGVEIIRKWSQEGRRLASFDLSAATDRWPIHHQFLVMRSVFGERIAQVWKEAMSFFTPWCPRLDSFVKYEVGQPMGAFSSWASLNISHHMVLRYLSHKIGNTNGPYDYVVLGDDLVIANVELAMLYEEYMSKLGVEINKTKSIISEPGKPSSAEFARSLVKDGRIVGTLSPGLLNEVYNHKQWFMAIELIRESRTKLGLMIFVSPRYLSVPKQLSWLLDQENNLLICISVPESEFQLPVTRVTDEQILDHSLVPMNEIYCVHENKWWGLDGNAVKATIQTRWLKDATESLNSLNKLMDLVKLGNSSPYLGYLLEKSSHPIRTLIEQIDQDITTVMWAQFAGDKKRLANRIINTDIDMLIQVLSKGISYRQWRSSKNLRTKKMSKFILKMYKDVSKVDTSYLAVQSAPGWGDIKF